MRLQVLIDDSNEILGIIHPTERGAEDTSISAHLVPDRGQELIEIEVPDEVRNAGTPHELHLLVRRFLPR